MPKVNLLYDVEPTILTLCKQGANRQRIFLKKEHEGSEKLVTSPGGAHLLRKSDGEEWSYFYCVVAEPGAREDPGMGDGAGSGIEDQWKDAAEIRKAAHYFAKSERLVTGLHDTVEPFGSVVENAIAIADFTVDTPEGAQTIKKGSWYVGIEPTEAGKAAIDAGEFTGLSLEGPGYRELVELAKSGDDERVSLWKKLGEVMGISPDRLQKDSGTLKTDPPQEDDVADKDFDKLNDEVQDLKKAQGAATTAITELSGVVKNLVERLDAKKDDKGSEEKETSVADLKKSIDEFTISVAERLDGFDETLDKLAEGGSTQDHNPDTLKKSGKSDYELSGIL